MDHAVAAYSEDQSRPRQNAPRRTDLFGIQGGGKWNAKDEFPWNLYSLRRPMKKKSGNQSKNGRSKRSGESTQVKPRKRGKKKESARPIPLWLQVLSRVD